MHPGLDPGRHAPGIALAKYRVRFARSIQIYLLLPFTIPLIGSGIGMMLILGNMGVLGKLWPVGIACAVINLPFMIWAVTASASNLSPDLELAAANCGAPPLQRFLYITLPAVLPGVITGSLLMFILALNEFLVSLLLVDARSVTLPVQIYNSIRSIISRTWPRSRSCSLPAPVSRSRARPPGRSGYLPEIEMTLRPQLARYKDKTMTSVSFYEYSKLNAEEKAALLRRSETDISGFIEKVAPILEAVRTEGDKALARFGRELDKADVTEANLKVTAAEFDAAFKLVDASVLESVQFGIDNIRKFHEEQKPEAMWLKEIRPGAFAGDRFTPIQSVALYVPRGKGSFPSVTMMTRSRPWLQASRTWPLSRRRRRTVRSMPRRWLPHVSPALKPSTRRAARRPLLLSPMAPKRSSRR